MSDDEGPIGDALLYEAWCVIANVSEGDWSEQPIAWQDAAINWRDKWHARLSPPGTVCVRLDGLADKIAAWVNHNLTWSNLLGDDKMSDDQFAESLISLLQSLAVQ